MSHGAWYPLFNEVRETTLDIAASAAEAYASFSRRSCGGCRKPGCSSCFPAAHCRTEGDFLADWVRLNVSYMSQLARLGSAYTCLATRAMDRFYSSFEDHYSGGDAGRYPPGQPSDTCCELQLMGKASATALGRLSICNSLGITAAFTVEGIKAGTLTVAMTQIGDPTQKFDVTLTITTSAGVGLEKIDIPSGEKARFTVEADTAKLTSGKQYHGSVRAMLADRASILQIFVDVL